MEKTIGIKITSILASILIFIGIIYLGVALYDVIPDVGKVCIMYGISLALMILGLLKMDSKDSEEQGKYHILFTAVASCGICACYISTIITYSHFKLFSTPIVICLLAVWVLAMVSITKLKSDVFKYICSAGIIATAIFNMVADTGAYTAIVMYLISVVVLFIACRKEEYCKNWMFLFQLPIVMTILSIGHYNDYVLLISLVGTFAVWYLSGLLIGIEDNSDKEIYIATLIITAACALFNKFIFAFATDNGAYYYTYVIVLQIIFLLVMIVNFIKYRNETFDKGNYYLVNFVFLACSMLSAYMLQVSYKSTLAMVAIVLTIFYAITIFIEVNEEDRIVDRTICGTMYVLMTLPLLLRPDFGKLLGVSDFTNLIIIYSIHAVFLIIALALAIKEKSFATRYALVLLIVLPMFSLVRDLKLDILALFGIVIVLDLLLNSKLFIEDGESNLPYKSCVVCGEIINILDVIIGILTVCTISDDNEIKIYVSILLLIFVALVNTVRMFNSNTGLCKIYCSGSQVAWSIFSGLKMTIVSIVIVHRFTDVGYVYSAVTLAVALALVVLGFALSKKSIRIYGLAVMGISIFKLVFFDIGLSTTIEKAVVYLSCGIICFAIGFIYSKLEEKIDTDSDEAEIEEDVELAEETSGNVTMLVIICIVINITVIYNFVSLEMERKTDKLREEYEEEYTDENGYIYDDYGSEKDGYFERHEDADDYADLKDDYYDYNYYGNHFGENNQKADNSDDAIVDSEVQKEPENKDAEDKSKEEEEKGVAHSTDDFSALTYDENFVKYYTDSEGVMDLSDVPGKILPSYSVEELEGVKSIILPSDIETMKHASISECHELEELTLPDSLKTIEANWLGYCPLLHVIKYKGEAYYTKEELLDKLDSNGVTDDKGNSIAEYGYSIGYENGMPDRRLTVSDIRDCVVHGDTLDMNIDFVPYQEILFLPEELKINKLIMNENETCYWGYYFGYNEDLEEVVLPSDIEMLPEKMFYKCPNLKTIEYKGKKYTSQSELIKALDSNGVTSMMGPSDFIYFDTFSDTGLDI